MVFKKGISIFALMGLFLGVTVDVLLRNNNTTLFYYVFLSVFCLLFALAYNEKKGFRLLLTSGLVSLFLTLPLVGLYWDTETLLWKQWVGYFITFPVFAYIGHSFHYAYHEDNTWKVNYSTLFAAVWNTIPLLFVAAFFASLARLLIFLTALIFKTAGFIDVWNLLFENWHFSLICYLTLFFMGLGLGRLNLGIIYNIRFLLLKMMVYLFPFLALISMLYLALSLGTVENKDLSALTLLIPLCILGIVFFNAYFQDGTALNDNPKWLTLFLKFYRIALFCMTLMMAYKLHQEFPLAIAFLIYIAMAILYGLTYAITVFFPNSLEIKWIRLGNIFTSLLFLAAVFVVNLPFNQIDYTLASSQSQETN